MPSIYRDGLAEQRIELERRIRVLVERGAGIDRAAIPRRLRRELTKLEGELVAVSQSLDDMRRLEEAALTYETTIDAALAIVEPQANLARQTRSGRLRRLLVAALLSAPMVAALTLRTAGVAARCSEMDEGATPNVVAIFSPTASPCVYASDEECAHRCQTAGECAERNGDCVAKSDLHCRGSESCWLRGHCTARSGKCVVGGDGDCARSEACLRSGRCSAARASGEDFCVATRHEYCAASAECVTHGHCFAIGGECLQKSLVTCTFSDECADHGLCSAAANGDCVAASDADCRYAAACLHFGRCVAKGRRCQALADWGCLGSSECRERGRCKAENGACVVSDG